MPWPLCLGFVLLITVVWIAWRVYGPGGRSDTEAENEDDAFRAGYGGSGARAQGGTARPKRPLGYAAVTTAWERHASERAHLQTLFHPANGGRPYVKRTYKTHDGWGDISGYCARKKLPQGLQVQPPPSENPNKPMSKDEFINFLDSKGAKGARTNDGALKVNREP